MILHKISRDTIDALRPHARLYQSLVSQRAAEALHIKPNVVDALAEGGGIRLEGRDIQITRTMINDTSAPLTQKTKYEFATQKAAEGVARESTPGANRFSTG